MFKSPKEFRLSLEARLRNRAEGSEVHIVKLRMIVAFERLMARLQHGNDDRWLIKGGFALQLRLGTLARTTRDLDITMNAGSPIPSASSIHEILATSSAIDLGDHFSYELARARELPVGDDTIHVQRIQVRCLLANKLFENFHVDVGVGDPLPVPSDILPSSGLLDFAGFPELRFHSVSPEQHFAEKIHAFTTVRDDRENSRVRDLPDLMLLIGHCQLDPEKVAKAVREVFLNRNARQVPRDIADPPISWDERYAVFVDELALPQKTVGEAMTRLRTFWKELPWPSV